MGEQWREKLACAYFFILPALTYGILSSRLPAIREIAGLDTTQVGFLLLSLGVSTLVGLLCADYFIEKYTAHTVTVMAGIGIPVFITFGMLFPSYLILTLILFLTGLCVGFCDVGMNAQGIILERKSGKSCLAFLHACSSLGAAAGALVAFAFTAFDLSPFINFFAVFAIFGCFFLWSAKKMPREETQFLNDVQPFRLLFHIPFFVIYCGIFSLFCHTVEGSAGSWGSIFLVSVKHASQETGALVFAVFTGAMVIARFLTDNIRHYISDFILIFLGSAFSAVGMTIVLLSPNPALCLMGYGIMGFCVAPITPILFSRAGHTPNVSAGQASAVVSIFSYTGLLFFPPFFGMLDKKWGLWNALWLIVAFCIIMCLGSFRLRRKA